MKELIAIFQMLALLLQSVTSLGYQQEDIIIHNYRQKVYLLEARIQSGAEIKSALAQDSVFGFETIGQMGRRTQAAAAVNGMFFDDLGSPAGLLCENGHWIRLTDIGTPALVIEDKPSIQEVQVKAFWRTGERSAEIFAYNIGAFPGQTNVFTREYGNTNRVFRPQVSYRIENNVVTARYLVEEPVEIGKDLLFTYLLPEDTNPEVLDWQQLPMEIPIYEIGQEIWLDFQVTNQAGVKINPKNVYQTGGWLIQAGQINARSYETFIGYTTSLQPRTAVGLDQQGNLFFLVADGRQKQIAEGLSGQWLAEVMSQFELTNAAYLDGGASSAMWLKNGLVNTPAYFNKIDGKEIAHTILLNRIWLQP
ncbi:phosphodiester glycosidase family protein [Clostridiales bacterium COT073_COT-073]|nr:phosphodiester glycosidase family protein [Clostridiales bacterium COT073_COT-073]